MKKSKFMLLSLLLISIIIVLIVLIINKKDNRVKLTQNDYNNANLITLDEEKLKEKQENKETFIVYIHVPGLCTSEIPFDPLVNKFIKQNEITIYSLPYSILKNTNLNEYIKYSPSLAIIKDGKLLRFLDANSDKDFEYYSSLEGLNKWVKSYVKLK